MRRPDRPTKCCLTGSAIPAADAARRTTAVLALLFAGLVGAACEPDETAKREPAESNEARAQWGRSRGAAPAGELSAEQQAAILELEALGYVDGVAAPTQASGVTVHDRERACEGLNLIVSGHAPFAELIDMQGRRLHAWSTDFDTAFPDFPLGERSNIGRKYWRRVVLRPRGELFVIHEGMGAALLDRESRVLWSVPNRAHHDAAFDAEGRIHLLTREAQFHPRFGIEAPVLLDYVTVLSPDGQRLKHLSIDQAYLNSKFPAPDAVHNRKGDVYHTNAIKLLDGRLADRIPAFARGNLLLSFRNLDRLAVLDPEAERIVWVAEGDWDDQHEPVVLETGHILLFDNKGGEGPGGRSRVLEIDPMTLQVVWQYQGTAELPFDSDILGSCSRLPNGNTLAVESVHGRAIEVTPEGRIVWEYLNPERAGEHDEFIAVIPDLQRIDPAALADWLVLPVEATG